MSQKRGDVVIAMFPNADSSGGKPRPVVVVQSDVYNSKIQNLVVAAITTNLKYSGDPMALLIDATTPDGKATGLVKNSLISCINLATITDTLVAKRIGELSDTLKQKLDACLKAALEIT
jgi:mRNA interferase MazF